MVATVQTLKEILYGIRPVSEQEAIKVLAGVAGRGAGQFNSRLKEWLESNPTAFSESISVEETEHPQDRGVDVFITGNTTNVRVGFQIKSDNDVQKKDFATKTKAQITDSETLGLDLLIIILACRPTTRHKLKYGALQNQILYSPSQKIFFISPTKAAALWKAFDVPITVPQPGMKSWSQFFREVKKEHLASFYLDEWPDLLPDERFQPPNQFSTLEKAVTDKPLTLLVGPPAAGKTFSSVQILWRAYQEGKTIAWISPTITQLTEGPISGNADVLDFKRRINLLVRNLGIASPQPPIDSTDFVAKHLRPNSIVYIEDPFGKTEDEYSHSLHTYDFFDLNSFINAISGATSRIGCHILISSREEIFDRWLKDSNEKRKSLPPYEQVQIAQSSYNVEQNLDCARLLATAKSFADPDNLAEAIIPFIQTPYEAELIVRELPLDCTPEIAANIAKQYKGDLKEKIRMRIATNNDEERLFLFLLVALSTGSHGRNRYMEWYQMMYQALNLKGNTKSALTECLNRYRPLITKHTTYSFDHVVAKEKGDSGESTKRVLNIVATDDYHLEPVHSTVSQAIEDHLKNTSLRILNEIAIILPSLTPSNPSGDYSWYTHGVIAAYLLSLGIGCETGPAQEALCLVLFEHKGISEFSLYSIMIAWPNVSREFKDKYFQYLSAEKGRLTSLAAGALTSRFSSRDAWDILRILSKKRALGITPIQFTHPWKYLFLHIQDTPKDLRDTLDKCAREHPGLLIYALGEPMVEHWHIVPSLWKNAFQSGDARAFSHGQLNVLCAIAKHWMIVPDELTEYFKKQSKHSSYEIRANCGIASLIYYEVAPNSFKQYLEAALEDVDIRVPLEVFFEGAGNDEHDEWFCRELLRRSDEVSAACMLRSLLSRGISTEEIWKSELARACIKVGGEWANAVLAYEYLQQSHKTQIFGYAPPEYSREEQASLTLARIYAYANNDEKTRTLGATQVRHLIESLSEPYRDLGLYYLSIQFHYLPTELQQYVLMLESGEGDDAKAVLQGKKKRQPEGGSRRLYGFPISYFLPSSSVVE